MKTVGLLAGNVIGRAMVGSEIGERREGIKTVGINFQIVVFILRQHDK